MKICPAELKEVCREKTSSPLVPWSPLGRGSARFRPPLGRGSAHGRPSLVSSQKTLPRSRRRFSQTYQISPLPLFFVCLYIFGFFHHLIVQCSNGVSIIQPLVTLKVVPKVIFFETPCICCRWLNNKQSKVTRCLKGATVNRSIVPVTRV